MPDILSRALSGDLSISPRSILRLVLLAALLILLIPYGGVLDPYFLPGLILVALVFALSAFGVRDGGMAARTWSWMFIITIAISAYVLLQSLLLPWNPLAHPIWANAAEVLGTVGVTSAGAISVEPTATRRALLSLILPAVVLMAVIALYRNDDDAMRLWRFLFGIGVAIAAFGIVEFLLAPDRLLFMERRHAMRGVTGVFVNVNTAATFFGIALLMGLGLCIERYRKTGGKRLLHWFVEPRFVWSDPRTQFLVYVCGCLTVLVALVLTQSRGGVGAAFAMVLLVLFWAVLRYGLREAPVRRKVIVGGIFMAGALAALSQMASRTALRIETQGFEDARLCMSESAMRAIGDHFFRGSGLGTFETIFPLYRDPTCGFGRQIDMAHNTWIEGMLGLGLAFPVLVLAVLIVLGRGLMAARRRRRYRFSGIVGATILGLVALHAIVDFSLQIPGIAAYAAACIAVALVLATGRSRRPERGEQS
jgi:hypothetical protein